jgi:hypothetical protein
MVATLLAAATYHLLFGLWANLWPYAAFDLAGLVHPNHPVLWRAVGWASMLFGGMLLLATLSPLRQWPLVLISFLKCTVALGLVGSAVSSGELPQKLLWLALVDDLIWWPLLFAILWRTLQTYAGRSFSKEPEMSVVEACESSFLSSGESLAAASARQPLAVVFLRHFGCTFTRRILRELETLKAEADRQGARLVLVHMLQQGRETEYLDRRDAVARISDPQCELYRAFGLGKGGFFELFGPSVWLPLFMSLVRGCGVGHLAGDGAQMPGAFLLRNSVIVASQRPRTQAYLPDLRRLFEGSPAPAQLQEIPA